MLVSVFSQLKQWEVEHGRIPDEAAVLFKFGYASKFWDPEKYFNTLNITLWVSFIIVVVVIIIITFINFIIINSLTLASLLLTLCWPL